MLTALALLLQMTVSPAFADPPRHGHWANHHRHARAAQFNNPWNRDYRPAHRPGFRWVPGCVERGAWVPGYWTPVVQRAGFVWVHGYWDGAYYVDGYWRPAARRGFQWQRGYYNGRNYVTGAWRPLPRRSRVRRGRAVHYRR